MCVTAAAGVTVPAGFEPVHYFEAFHHHNMLNTSNYDESRMAEACEAIRAQKKPNITKTAREFGVPRETLRDRVNKGAQARTARKPVNKALQDYQEKALIR